MQCESWMGKTGYHVFSDSWYKGGFRTLGAAQACANGWKDAGSKSVRIVHLDTDTVVYQYPA